ncbi:MAG: hypothetical protein HY879_21360 [Deltaproteobacteria bacterium]|nr:hypothetical protein [Deltaproteobacteria bacterium]
MKILLLVILPSLACAFAAGSFGGNLAIAILHGSADFQDRKAKGSDALWQLWRPVQLAIGKWTTFVGMIVGALGSLWLWHLPDGILPHVGPLLVTLVAAFFAGFIVALLIVRHWAKGVGIDIKRTRSTTINFRNRE